MKIMIIIHYIKINANFKNFSILIIPIVLIELLFSLYFFYNGNTNGIIFKLFSNSQINQQIEYQLKWDENNKLVPETIYINF